MPSATCSTTMRIVTRRRSSTGGVRSICDISVEPSVDPHSAAGHTAFVDEPRERLTDLENQHAGHRVRAGLAENGPIRRLAIFGIQYGVKPQKHDRMGDRCCEEHECPR